MKNIFDQSQTFGVTPGFLGGTSKALYEMVPDRKYILFTQGTTTQDQWNTIAGTTGKTYLVGQVFTYSGAQTNGTGTVLEADGHYFRMLKIMQSDAKHASDANSYPQYRDHDNATNNSLAPSIGNSSGTSLGTEIDEFLKRTSRYLQYYEDAKDNTNFQYHDIWKVPMLPAVLDYKGVRHISKYETELDSSDSVMKAKITFDEPHGLVNDDRIYGYNFSNIAGTANSILNIRNSATQSFFAQKIDSTSIYLKTATGTGTSAFDIHLGTPFDNSMGGMLDDVLVYPMSVQTNLGSSPATYADGCLVVPKPGDGAFLKNVDSNVVRLTAAFTDANHTGTADSNSTDFVTHEYNDTINITSGFDANFTLFTDAAKTTPAALTTPTIANIDYTLTATADNQVQTIQNVNRFTLGLSESQFNALEPVGKCIVYVEANGSNITNWNSTPGGFSLTNYPITVDQGRRFLYTYFKTGSSISIEQGDRTQMTNPVTNIFTIGTSGNSVTLKLRFHEPAKTTGTYRMAPSASFGTTSTINNHQTREAGVAGWSKLNTTKFEIDKTNIIWAGNRKFKHTTAHNTQTAGAKFAENGYYKQNTSSTTYTDITLVSSTSETMPDVSAIAALDSNGFVTGSALPQANSVVTNNRGEFNDSDERVFLLFNADDTHTTASATTAGAEDVFDLDTEWDTNGFSTLKTWPDTVLPSSIQMKYNQPSQTTLSQGGVKYVRNLGFTKWQMEVTYPPMTESQFAVYQSAAQKAKGQFVPFQFDIKKSNNTFFLNFHDANTTTDIRLQEEATGSDNVVLLQGFDNNETINEGELMIMGSTKNGNIHTITNSGLSNIYGEFKARLAYPIGTTMVGGQTAFLDPEHFVVTLGEDGFEYAKDTNGFYYVKIKLDLDEYK
jgi:hypothetical protein